MGYRDSKQSEKRIGGSGRGQEEETQGKSIVEEEKRGRKLEEVRKRREVHAERKKRRRQE